MDKIITQDPAQPGVSKLNGPTLTAGGKLPLTDLDTTGAANGDAIVLSGGVWTPVAAPGTGTVTSVDATEGVQTVAGVAITASGTIRGAYLPNNQTGVTYTYLTGDRGKLVSHSNAGTIAGTLPQAGASFPNGWFVFVQNRGAGTLTITPTVSTIDGAATLVLAQGQGALIVSDGTNYLSQRGLSSGSATLPTGFTSTDQTITAAGALTIAHGLGSTPRLLQAFLRNTSADAGFTLGQIVPASVDPQDSANYGQSVIVDATNLTVRFGTAGVFIVNQAATGVPTAIDATKWVVFYQAWK